MCKGAHLKKSRILLLVPTGVAAINIDGATIHIALGITVGSKLYPLNDRQQGILQNKLAKLNLLSLMKSPWFLVPFLSCTSKIK